jgi:hypothetical protein
MRERLLFNILDSRIEGALQRSRPYVYFPNVLFVLFDVGVLHIEIYCC